MTIRKAAVALRQGTPAVADRLLTKLEAEAYASRATDELREIWSLLAPARTQRRARAAAGRIDLHTHTTASDGEMTVEQLLCEHFVRGQILIDDHNIIDSLPEARRLVNDRDLELDVFLGIEVICTHQRRAFEFHAIAPTYSVSFVALCRAHRQKWDRACELFVHDLVARDDLFTSKLAVQIAEDFAVGGSFDPLRRRYDSVRERITGDLAACACYLRRSQTFDMGRLWNRWELGRPGDPPQLCHRFFAFMRCYALNAYRAEFGDWFDYDALAARFHDVGCLVSHNHPNYWDEDFVGELPYELQTKWIHEWATRGIIDALEVWTPPFASQRVPAYWQSVCEELGLIPLAGTDCHSGREEECGGRVENHPEIPAQVYDRLTASATAEARRQTDPWAALAAWRSVLEIDYAQEEALRECVSLAGTIAGS